MDSVAQVRKQSLADTKILTRAVTDSFRKLAPRTMVKNPVMFVVEVGAVLTTVQLVWNAFHHVGQIGFGLQITLWLWFTVLFANFAEAMAEGRGKAQADTLRKARAETQAHLLTCDNKIETVPSSKLRSGDIVVVTAGDFIPGDGEVIEGVASVDESAITGESAPVIRESGGDRSAVTGGTRVLSDEIKVRITSNPGETFLDRMIKLVEGASRQKTPNEIALNILLAGLTIIFLLAVVTLQPFAIYSGAPQSIFVLVSLLVCLIPTTIGGLLSAIGIAGMDRMIQRNVIAMSGRAVEASGDVDVLLLDKTGTITLGNRAATRSFPRWRTRLRKADPSSCSPRSCITFEVGTFLHTPQVSSHFPHKPGCQASTLTAAKSAKEHWKQLPACAPAAVTTFLWSCRFVFVRFRMRAERRCWSQRTAAC